MDRFRSEEINRPIEGSDPSRKRGFFCQMKIAIIRIVLLSKRKPISLFCELFIPIIFVVGSVIIWALLSNAVVDGADYLNRLSLEESKLFYSLLPFGMCYMDEPIGTLQNCSKLENFEDPNNLTTQLMCSRKTTGAPDGVCGLGITGIAARIGWRQVVIQNTSYIPSLDELILIQWMNRIFYDNTRFRYITANSYTASMYSTGTLFFAPSSSETNKLVSFISRKFEYFKYVYGGTLETVDLAEKRVKQRKGTDPPIWGIIQVNSLNESSFDVAIRLNNSALPLRKMTLVPNYAGGIPSGGSAMYLFSGFLTIQKILYEYYFSEIKNYSSPSQVAILPQPTVKYGKHLFLTEVADFGPLIIVFGFLYPVSQMTKRLVLDKELRLREAMLIMGLSRTVMYLSWVAIYSAQFFIVSIIITVLMKFTYLPNANAFVIFLCLFLFSISTITLSGLISSFFSRSRLAALIAPIIYFAMSVPLFVMNGSTPVVESILTILSPSALSIGFQLIFSEELNGGFTAQDLVLFSPSMILVLVMLLVDFFIYGVLMLYFDLVLPQEWGTRFHPLFFIIDPIQKCCCSTDIQISHDLDGRAENGVFEEFTDSNLNPIQIQGLHKEFGNGKKKITAVNHMHWSLKEGEISVLLGHNGAGKTTLMNMMTGMITADAGDCFVYGKSLRYSLSKVREEIGFCPQHNILWPDLTCEEHLWFYGSIKGLHGQQLNKQILFMLESVDLAEKRTWKSSQLSGGQKRKLSVAIAFVGGSRLIFLDEPTAGMDVNARRSTWDLLRFLSNNHSILLTTHFMDEADLLGDSVAIMHQGRLQCSGSNFYLKTKLGIGYALSISVTHQAQSDFVYNLVMSSVSSAQNLGGNTAGEFLFRLPMDAKDKFSNLLSDIEDCVERGQGGITGYSLSATTLEEVFIKIVEDNSPNEVTECTSGSSVWNITVLDSRSSVLWSQFKAEIVKRFWNALRDRRTQFFQIVCPVVCVLLAMVIMLIPFFDNTSLTISSRIYDTTVEIDVANCAEHMDLSIPFSTNAYTNIAKATSVTDLNSFQLATYYSHPFKIQRYSGVVCEDATFNETSFVLYNASSYHETAVGLFNLFNGYYHRKENPESNLKTICHCMPPTNSEKQLTNALYSMMISIIIMIPFTFIPSTFVGWIVREKQCRARHLQNISGLSFYIYWIANFIFDTLCYTITLVLVTCIFFIFNRQEYIGSESIGATLLILFLYGISGILMSYALSFMFNDYSSAQNTVLLASFITGFLLVLGIAVLSFVESTKKTANVLKWVFRVVPSYCVGEGILNLAQLYLMKAFGAVVHVWTLNDIGWPCIFMAAELPFFIAAVFFFDHPGRRQRTQRLFHNPDARPENLENEDEDVIQEREIVERGERLNDLITVKNMRKVYGNGKVAVRNVSFGVQPGEVFAFLGTNGAGKTTTISILCQELYPTSGRGTICGHDIVEESSKALRCVGYCPQFDATLDLLTVEEHLRLYAGVRAIDYSIRDTIVNDILTLCQLGAYKGVKAQSLSGGNRRKLSVGISLIGGPRVVFLDEPSAGMDPVARRGLWGAVKAVSHNCSIVLTTHHLEEVEALAQRVAIMIDGSLRCIGNKTHLKNKYGNGFEITVRIAGDEPEKKEIVMDFFETNFDNCIFQEFRARRLIYSVPQTFQLSNIFSRLEENIHRLPITDYSVSQTSIEAVFLRISADAENNDDENNTRKCCCWC